MRSMPILATGQPFASLIAGAAGDALMGSWGSRPFRVFFCVGLKTKSLPLECKVLESGDGQFEAYVSVFGVKDSYGDVMEYGCFSASLAKKRPVGIPFHDWRHVPIAKTLEIREVPPGDMSLPDHLRQHGALYVKAQLLTEISAANDVYVGLKAGVITEFSIGYYELDAVEDKEARHVKAVDLVEYSPVLRGANPLTELISVKSEGRGLSFAAHSEQVLGSLQEYVKRASDLSRLRAEKGDAPSRVRIEEFRALHSELGLLLESLEAPSDEEVARAKAAALLAM